MRFSCRPLNDGDTAALTEFLEAGGPMDAFLLDALAQGGIGGFFGAWDGPKLGGAVFLRRGAISAASRTSRAASYALAATASARGPWSSIVGPEEPCRSLAEALRTSAPFRVDRVQAFMAASRGDPLGPGETGLRRAMMADLGALVPLVARYRVEDGLSAPEDDHTAWIRAHTAERITVRLLWVVEQAGRIVFTAAYNFAGPRGAGLGGVYTIPEARGRGIAGRAMADLARIALEDGPVVTLHVDPRNAAAIRAYEKAGLRRAGEFRLTFR